MARGRPTRPRAKSSGGKGKTPRTAPVGSFRAAQSMHTYGIGSVVELPHISVVVSGMSTWWHGSNDNRAAALVDPDAGLYIDDPRLVAALRANGNKFLSGLIALPHLPELNNSNAHHYVGVQSDPFPTWLVCPRCRMLMQVGNPQVRWHAPSIKNPDTARFAHDCSGHRGPRQKDIESSQAGQTLLPTRFVVVCPHGHMDDFPFSAWVHDGVACDDNPKMWMRPTGRAERADDQTIVCECGEERGVATAFRNKEFSRGALPDCSGLHPHLAQREACTEQTEPLMVGSSNLWFGESQSALALPYEGETIDGIDLSAKTKADLLDDEGFREDLLGASSDRARRRMLSVNVDVTAEQASRMVDLLLNPPEPSDDGDMTTMQHRLLRDEWTALTGEPLDEPYLRTSSSIPMVLPGLADPSSNPLVSVTRVERLQERVAFTGFRRIKSSNRKVHLMGNEGGGRTSYRLPAVEATGEGIFLQFDPDIVRDLIPASIVDDFAKSYTRWAGRRGMTTDFEVRRDPLFVWLHTFSHMLVRQIAVVCGYPMPALAERLYAPNGNGDDPHLCGLLIYTTEDGKFGTLGGLVAQAEHDRLREIIADAIDSIRICPHDPFCADHVPGDSLTGHGDTLTGATCHSCLFLPETTCGHLNQYLDRRLLVDVMGQPGTGLFA